jgi:tetratricopeptide (TPR) repeat protein
LSVESSALNVERSASRGAVFLSYASQDAAAVLRIAEALRAAGVEVWFDRDELVGGDAWDAKIRGQIASCALFVPVISANTQARLEGYFRIEWKLAARRTHAMATARAFLLPVVIDETRDAEAHVPDEFRDVQWTRLADAEGVEKFCVRARALLDGIRSIENPLPVSCRVESPPSVLRRRLSLGAQWALGLGVVGAILVGVFSLPPGQRDRASPPQSAPGLRLDASPKVAGPADELIAKARALYEPWDLATQDDFRLAEQLLRRATDADLANSEAWAALAICGWGLYDFRYDYTPARLSEVTMQAARAIKLAPASDYARFAQALALLSERSAGKRGEAIQILRGCVQRQPGDKFMLRMLGVWLARAPDTEDEGFAFLARAAALAGGDPAAEFKRGQILMFKGRTEEAIAAFDRTIKLAPANHWAHSFKISTLLFWRGDAEAARKALEQVPAGALREDRLAFNAVRVWFAVNQADKALELLRSIGPFFGSGTLGGPTAYFRGLAHRRAGRLSAAQTEWQVALQEVQRRLTAAPADAGQVLWKARLEASLGQAVEARASLELFRQLKGGQRDPGEGVDVEVLLGSPEQGGQVLRDLLGSGSVARLAAGLILFDPALDPLRSDPSFGQLIEQAREVFAKLNRSASAKL